MLERGLLPATPLTRVLHLLRVKVRVEKLLQVGLRAGVSQDAAGGVVIGEGSGGRVCSLTFLVAGGENRTPTPLLLSPCHS